MLMSPADDVIVDIWTSTVIALSTAVKAEQSLVIALRRPSLVLHCLAHSGKEGNAALLCSNGW